MHASTFHFQGTVLHDSRALHLHKLKYIGVSIPRTAARQYSEGRSINKNNMSLWNPGDILVYASGGRVNHVALYLGNGMLMHALNSKYGTLIQGVSYYEKWDHKNSLYAVRRYL